MELEFIKPKTKPNNRMNWCVSDQTKAIVKYYTEYTNRDEHEVVDTFLKNIIKDKDFIDWIKNKRRNKRIMSQIFGVEESEEESIG
jgi:hypothetical protein